MSQYSPNTTWSRLAISSLIVICFSFYLLSKLNSKHKTDAIIIYCAAGIKLPIQELVNQYEQESQQTVLIEYGSSGDLEARLQQEATFSKKRADLYIPADDSFSKRTQKKGLSFYSLPLAQFKLCLASKANDSIDIPSLKVLIDKKIPYLICNEKAGAGKKLKSALEQTATWQVLKENSKLTAATVSEAANSIKNSKDIRVGIIWNTTAKQFSLRVIELEEFKNLNSRINVNFTQKEPKPAAIEIATYLSLSAKSQRTFEKFGFENIAK